MTRIILAALLTLSTTTAFAAGPGILNVLPQGAQDVKKFSEMTQFTSSKKPSELEYFYVKAIKVQGYTPSAPPSHNGQYTYIYFIKGKEHGSVVLTDKGASTNVMLTYTPNRVQ